MTVPFGDLVIAWCPSSTTWAPYPSTSMLFVIIALFGVGTSVVIGIRYNSVRVLDRVIRSQNISNSVWLLFFVGVALRGISEALRLFLSGHTRAYADSNSWNLAFSLPAAIIHGFDAFALAMALNHQRRFRSAGSSLPDRGDNAAQTQSVASTTGSQSIPSLQPRDPTTTNTTEGHSLLVKRPESMISRHLTGGVISYAVLFVLSMIFLYLKEAHVSNHTFAWIYTICFFLQRVPVAALAVLISIQPNSPDGPTPAAKSYLVIASFLHLATDWPLYLWTALLPDTCALHFANWIDIILIVYIMSLALFFVFLRIEYRRNKEECIWTTVSQIQDTFDFRRF